MASLGLGACRGSQTLLLLAIIFRGVIFGMLGMMLPIDRGENLFTVPNMLLILREFFRGKQASYPYRLSIMSSIWRNWTFLVFPFCIWMKLWCEYSMFSAQIKLTVQGLFDLNQDIPAFKEHLRDFMVQIKVSILALHVWNVLNYEKYQVHVLILKIIQIVKSIEASEVRVLFEKVRHFLK